MSHRNWTARAVRSLAVHVDRLRDTLDTLGARLRDAIARSIGGTVAGAVHDAVHHLLEPQGGQAFYDPSPQSPNSGWWAEPDYEEDLTWHDGTEEWEDATADEGGGDATPAGLLDGRGRWKQAVAVGCQAAAWWLRRERGRFVALAALGVGLVSALAAYIAGPVVVTGACLANSALSLSTLSAVRPGTERDPAWRRPSTRRDRR